MQLAKLTNYTSELVSLEFFKISQSASREQKDARGDARHACDLAVTSL
jgi:hypothetical protein